MSWFRKEKPKPPLTAVTEQLGSVPMLRIGAVVGVVVGLWALSQIILAAASAAAGLAVIGVIGIAGVGAFQALPLLAQKWENRLLAARKQEARKNPIEQAENDLLRRTQQYDAFKAAVATIGGLISSLKTELVGMKRESPDSDFSSEAEAVKKMDLFYSHRLELVTQAKTALDTFDKKVKEARMKWNFAVKANEAIRVMNATDRDAKMNAILTEIAFDSVQQEFDTIFSKIDVEAAEISSKKQIDFGGKMTLDLSAIEIPQLQHAGAA